MSSSPPLLQENVLTPVFGFLRPDECLQVASTCRAAFDCCVRYAVAQCTCCRTTTFRLHRTTDLDRLRRSVYRPHSDCRSCIADNNNNDSGPFCPRHCGYPIGEACWECHQLICRDCGSSPSSLLHYDGRCERYLCSGCKVDDPPNHVMCQMCDEVYCIDCAPLYCEYYCVTCPDKAYFCGCNRAFCSINSDVSCHRCEEYIFCNCGTADCTDEACSEQLCHECNAELDDKHWFCNTHNKKRPRVEGGN